MFGAFEAIYSFITRQVGLRTDAADAAGSLHAKLGNITNRVNTIGTSADTRASNTVMGWLNTPIKSIQRGLTTYTGNYAMNVTISAVNLSKAFITVSQSVGSDYVTSLVYARLTSTTNLELKRYISTEEIVYVAWEVVEFY